MFILYLAIYSLHGLKVKQYMHANVQEIAMYIQSYLEYKLLLIHTFHIGLPFHY